MPKLPSDLNARDVCRVLERIGFSFRRRRGSHIVMGREEPHARVVVPDHRFIRPGTLKSILHDAGLSLEEFLELLR